MATQYAEPAQPFTPAQPPRTPDWQHYRHLLYGERMRNTVYGLSEPAFDVPHARRKFLHFWTHIVSDPEMIGHVLLDNHANYARPKLTRQLLRPLLGNGLLNAEGDDWRRQRRLIAPSFSPASVARTVRQMAEAAEEQLAGWPEGPARLDMAQVATQLTATIIARTLFSDDPRLASSEAHRHIERVVSSAGQPRLLRMLGLEVLDWSPWAIRLRRSRRYLREALLTMVYERGAGGGGDDFFGGLIRAFHADMPAKDADRLAVDNAVTFYVAGHETTAVALAWAAYLLAAQPAVQEELRAEAMAAIGTDPAALADRLPLLRQFLDETMRLYPPVVQVIREALADDEFGGRQIRKGEMVFVYPWILHRHRKLWDDPDTFDLHRFAPDRAASLHRFQYMPFGAGPRICVGARFATVEALVILAQWLAHRRFRLPPGFAPKPTGTITLRPQEGMPLIVEPLG